MVMRDRYRQVLSLLVATTSAAIGLSFVATDGDPTVRLILLALFGGGAIAFLRVASTVVRVQDENLLVRNPWRTYRLGKDQIRDIGVGPVGSDPLMTAVGPYLERSDGRRIFLYALSQPYRVFGREGSSEETRVAALRTWWTGRGPT